MIYACVCLLPISIFQSADHFEDKFSGLLQYVDW